MRVQRQNIQYVAETLRGPNLAVRIWGKTAESRVMRARLCYSNPNAGNVDVNGKLKPLPKPPIYDESTEL